MINILQIRNELKGVIELSEELSINDNSIFGNIVENINGTKTIFKQTKQDIINNLKHLYECLKGKKVDQILFPQITSFYSDLKKLGASYRDKDANITDDQIRKVFLKEVERLIEPIENKYGFSLIQDIPDFHYFLSNGTVKPAQMPLQSTQQGQERPQQAPSAAIQHENARIARPIGKAIISDYTKLTDGNTRDRTFVICITDVTNEVKNLFTDMGKLIDGKFIAISDNTGNTHALKIPNIMNRLLRKYFGENIENDPRISKKCHLISDRKNAMDVTNIMNAIYIYLRDHQQQQNGLARR